MLCSKNLTLWPWISIGFQILLREYDTVARADNYFAEYRMLFSPRHSNEHDIFRGSCIDVIKSWLRKNLKAPASRWIMPFLKTNKQTNKTKLYMWCSFAEQLCFISVRVIIGTRVMCIFWIIYSRQLFLKSTCKWLNIQINTQKHTQWCEAQTTEKRTWLTPGSQILEMVGTLWIRCNLIILNVFIGQFRIFVHYHGTFFSVFHCWMLRPL